MQILSFEKTGTGNDKNSEPFGRLVIEKNVSSYLE